MEIFKLRGREIRTSGSHEQRNRGDEFCLRDEALAKRSLSILARELHAKTEELCPLVQSNALLVMGDLCVKFTNMVDKYLALAACLQFGIRDDSDSILDEWSQEGAIVRQHAVLLLSSLLLQDYIKWLGLLFHQFLVASANEDDGVANLAESTLCGPLLAKQPKLFFNQFVELLFVFNKCAAHPIYRFIGRRQWRVMAEPALRLDLTASIWLARWVKCVANKCIACCCPSCPTRKRLESLPIWQKKFWGKQ
jgi:hypothetical protein